MPSMTTFDPAGVAQIASVLWTRGEGCAELASLLAPTEPVRVVGDLTEECIRHRADLLVTRRLSGFDLVNLAVPVDFDPEGVGAVVAAVAGGPHSPLAARVARAVGERLGIPSSMACAYQDEEGRSRAVSLIEGLYASVPGIEYRLVQAEDAGGFISSLPPDALLVIGAPGGNWFQRLIFGKGVKLRQKAPSGAIIVRSAPARVFQAMVDPVFVGPLREASDILRIHGEQVLAVADQGKLVGIVRRSVLESAPSAMKVAEVMEEAKAVVLTDTVDEASSLAGDFDGSPVPVVDADGSLVGGLKLAG